MEWIKVIIQVYVAAAVTVEVAANNQELFSGSQSLSLRKGKDKHLRLCQASIPGPSTRGWVQHRL